jgi:putative acetyltransferase
MASSSIHIPSVSVRQALEADAGKITVLFYDTITTVNRKDYHDAQIAAWSAGANNTAAWLAKINEQHFFVAESNDILLGFSSITSDGYIDLMFVHKDYQGIGIGYLLLHTLEQKAKELKLQMVWSDVSITAKPFFLKKGFTVSKVYTKQVNNVDFENTIITKNPGSNH